jgi:hypothetical protein
VKCFADVQMCRCAEVADVQRQRCADVQRFKVQRWCRGADVMRRGGEEFKR